MIAFDAIVVSIGSFSIVLHSSPSRLNSIRQKSSSTDDGDDDDDASLASCSFDISFFFFYKKTRELKIFFLFFIHFIHNLSILFLCEKECQTSKRGKSKILKEEKYYIEK